MNVATQIADVTLGFEHNGIHLTPEEFDAISRYDDSYRYELIHGVLVVNPIPAPQVRGANDELGYLLRRYRHEHPRGSSLDETLVEEYVRSPQSRRRADRGIWAGLGRTPNPRRDVPTVVVEFVSAGRRSWQRNYIEKRDEYLALGVLEYWVIDRFQRTLTAFRTQDGQIHEQVVRQDEVYRPSLLPGFELPIAGLFAAADRWNAGV